MPPRKKAAPKASVKNDEAAAELQQFRREGEKRVAQLRVSGQQRKEALLQELFEIINRKVPKELLKMSLGDFLAMPVQNEENEDGEQQEFKVEPQDGAGDGVGNVTRHMLGPSSRQQQQTGLTAIRAAPDLSTVQRPANTRSVRQLQLMTPAGQRIQVPSLITPQVGNAADGSALAMRTIRRDEVAFSAAGSPVVLAPPTPGTPQAEEAQLRVLAQVMNADANALAALSPASREIAVNLKNFFNKKRSSAV